MRSREDRGETEAEEGFGLDVGEENLSMAGMAGSAGLWVGQRPFVCVDTGDTGGDPGEDEADDCMDERACDDDDLHAVALLAHVELRASSSSDLQTTFACSMNLCHPIGVPGDLDGDGLSDVMVRNHHTAEALLLSSRDCSTVLLRVPACFANVLAVAGPSAEGEISSPAVFLLSASLRLGDASDDPGVWLLPAETRGELSIDDLATRVTLLPEGGVATDTPSLSDVTGGGLSDAVLLVPGSDVSTVAVAPGPVTLGTDLEADTHWAGRGRFGRLAVGDLDGDGYADLAVAHQYDEAAGVEPGVHVILGPLSTDGDLDDPGFRITGLAHEEASAVAIGGDVTGDGAPELAVGDESGGGTRSAVHIFSGTRTGTVTIGEADASILQAAEDWYRTGEDLVFADVTGDGQPDLAVLGNAELGDVLLFEGR